MNMPLLSVEGLTVRFGALTAVREVSFSLQAGEILGIVGESGSGKSMTCRALTGLAPPMAQVEGRVTLEGRDLLTLGDAEWCRIRGPEIGMIFQNPASHLDPLRRIGAQIAAPMIRHKGLGRTDAMQRSVQLLADVGIHDPARRARAYPHEFSGGMKQRAMIAAAIGCGPRLLIADEPTTALDVTVQARILNLLKDLNRRHGLAIILISHDLGVIADICDRVVVMRHGEMVEQGTTAQIVDNPTHPYTRLLIDSQPGRRQWGGAGSSKPPSPQPLLRIRDLSVTFPIRGGGARGRMFRALDNVSLDVAAGDTIGIVGESGSGKSTLARAITRLVRPAGGRILIDGQEVHALTGEALTGFRRRVQMVFQNPYDSLNPRMTIRDSVAEPIWRHGLAPRQAALAEAGRLLETVEMAPDLHDRRPRQLSGGQCQRVGLARALALQPQILIADEITSALDVTTQAQILELLIRLQRERGLALIYISHDLAVVAGLCRHVHVFRSGRIVESGPAGQVLTAPAEVYTQELVASLSALPQAGAAALEAR